VDGHVGSIAGGGVVGLGLFGEVAMGGHAGELDDVAELHFTPPASLLGTAEGGDEAAGLTVELLVGGDDLTDLFFELAVGDFAFLLDVADGFVLMFEEFADGLDELVDGEVAFLGVAFGLGEESFEGLGGEVEELLIVGGEGFGAGGLEGVGELGAGVVEELALLGEIGFAGGELLGEGGGFETGGFAGGGELGDLGASLIEIVAKAEEIRFEEFGVLSGGGEFGAGSGAGEEDGDDGEEDADGEAEECGEVGGHGVMIGRWLEGLRVCASIEGGAPGGRDPGTDFKAQI